MCNWVVPRKDPAPFCKSCSLNRTVPDLSYPANVAAWSKVEAAKRRLIFTLWRLGIAPISKRSDPQRGLAFDILRPTETHPVRTGHQNGVITVNLDEADDGYRERQREWLGERYRTLIGHLRHETAHYYWDRLFKDHPDDDPLLSAFRQLFGNERADYTMALQSYYDNGPVPGWNANFITAYATSHPWEDWAETWAHYLHIIDGNETAQTFGIHGQAVPLSATLFSDEAVTLPSSLDLDPRERARFLNLIHSWAKLSPALNELATSLGHGNLYPFVLNLAVVRKLCFVHYVLGVFAPRRRLTHSLATG